MCNLFWGWTVGPIHSSAGVSLHIMRSTHCCSNKNNDPLLSFQGFAISSFFFFPKWGSRFKQTAPVLIRSHRKCLLPVFTEMANCGSAHNVVLCYCGSWTPDALKYAGFPSVIKWVYEVGLCSLQGCCVFSPVLHTCALMPGPAELAEGIPCLGRMLYGIAFSFPTCLPVHLHAKSGRTSGLS